MTHRTFGRSRLAALFGLAALLFPGAASAQTTHSLVVHSALPSYRSRTLDAVRRSPAFAARQLKYAKGWTNPSTPIKYSDGHVLNIQMVKNPPVADGDTHVDKHVLSTKSTTMSDGGSKWICATSQVNLTATSNTFLNNDYANSNSHIYPGAIFTFDDFYHGQYRETTGDRNPMTLVTDNPNINGDSSVTVQSPGVDTVRTAIATIYRRFTKDVGTESSAFDVLESNNSSSLNIQVSGGASGFGISFSDAFQQQSSGKTVSLTVDARKSLYSISVKPPEGTYFKNGVVDNTPNLMVVSNVVYGVRVLANLSVTFNSVSDANDFKIAYHGGLVDANAAMNYVQSHQSTVSSIHGYIVGGPGDSQVSFDINALKAEINRVIAGVNYQNARPISYQLSDMAGDVVGAQSATDTFAVQECSPSTAPANVTSVRVHFDDGRDGKDDDTSFVLYIYPGTNTQVNMKNEKQGSILGYESRNVKQEFKENRGYDVFMQGYSGSNGMAGAPHTLTFNTFKETQGGHLRLDCFRHGNDNWILNYMDIIFTYDDGTHQTLHIPGFTTSKGDGGVDWFFDGNLNLIQH